METRAILSHEEFVRIATTPEDDGWLTGRFLIFRPEIDAIDGWRNWDSPINRQLTEAQRTLYALSSTIYYAHRSGGIVNWFEEDISDWREILRLVSNVPWPNLTKRFRAAFDDQFGTALPPDRAVKAWKKRHAADYEKMIADARRIALRRTGRVFEEDMLCWLAMDFAEQGEMSYPPRVSDGAHEFGEWMRLGNAKSESVVHVSTWLIANEFGLRQP